MSGTDNGGRSKAAEVFIGPTRTEQAYVAAVVALIRFDVERISDAILHSEHTRALKTEGTTLEDLVDAVKNDSRFEWTSNRDVLESWLDSFKVAHLPILLEYFRPELRDASEEERVALLRRAVGYVNEYLEGLRRLTEFLQYGEAGAYEGLATKRLTQAARQVRAAELRELVRTERGTPLPYNKIGILLGEKPTPNQTRRSYDRRIKGMVDDGRDILKQALGGERGYQDYVESKRVEIEHWQTLSEDQQRERLMAENLPADMHVTIEVGK